MSTPRNFASSDGDTLLLRPKMSAVRRGRTWRARVVQINDGQNAHIKGADAPSSGCTGSPVALSQNLDGTSRLESGGTRNGRRGREHLGELAALRRGGGPGVTESQQHLGMSVEV